MRKLTALKKLISYFLIFNLLFLSSCFTTATCIAYEDQSNFEVFNNLLRNYEDIKEYNAILKENLNFLIDQNYPNNLDDLKDLEAQSLMIKKSIAAQRKELQAVCDACKANLVYNKNILIGIENLGNSCFLNSALQVILNASALNGKSINEEFIRVIESLQKDDAVKKVLINDCPTVYALFILFRLVNYGLENLSVITKDYVGYLLNYLNKSETVYDGVNQADSTEILQVILDRVLGELRSFYKNYYLSNEDQKKLERLILFLENMFTFGFVEGNSVFYQVVYNSKEISEDKINNEEDLSLETDVFDKNKIMGKTPQNLIIQLPRRHYKKIDTGDKNPKNNKPIFNIESIKLKNKIKIPEYLSTNDGNFRIKGIILHTGSALGGHYFIYIRKGENWYEINDSRVSSIGSDTKNILNSDLVLKNCASVIYEKI